MIYKIAKRSARSSLGNDFAEVWYTFISSFNKLKVPTRSLSDIFSDDQDKVRVEAEKQFFGHVDSLLGQLKILQRFVFKRADSEEGERKKVLLSLNANLSRAKSFLDKIKASSSPKGRIQIGTSFGLNRRSLEISLLNARDNIYLLASLNK